MPRLSLVWWLWLLILLVASCASAPAPLQVDLAPTAGEHAVFLVGLGVPDTTAVCLEQFNQGLERYRCITVGELRTMTAHSRLLARN